MATFVHEQLSVISMSTRSGGKPVSFRADRIIATTSLCWNWTGDTLIDSRPSKLARTDRRHASLNTQAPNSTIVPFSSAIGMKSAGDIRPNVPLFPSEQSFDADGASSNRIDLGLESDIELAVRHGVPKANYRSTVGAVAPLRTWLRNGRR